MRGCERRTRAITLHRELLRLEGRREAAKPSDYSALATKALRCGQEGIAVTSLILLEGRYQSANDLERARSVASRIQRLIPITRPASAALLDLEERLRVSNEAAPDKQPEQVGGTVAHSILLAVYARVAKTRIRQLQGLHSRAISEGKYLEGALCDLFLISEFRKAADRKGEKAALADLKKLERDFGVRDDEGNPYSELVASRPRKRGERK